MLKTKKILNDSSDGPQYRFAGMLVHASFRTGMELCEVEVANKMQNVDVFGIIYSKW